MFKQLYALAKTTNLIMTISANDAKGTLTIIVMPRAKKDATDAPGLATPLSLTATPEEFEADFPECLTRYTVTRQSLVDQCKATADLLEAAKARAVDKGVKATIKANNPKPIPKPQQTSAPSAPADDEPADTESLDLFD